MPKRQPSSQVNTREYSSPGQIMFKSFPPYVVTELHFCTVTMEEKEALEAVISLIKAGQKTWGQSFLSDIRSVAEVL